ncbi:hypothetical protein [Porphyrobacter sp. YT40]|uniref:hypothetical protein n=1 Tax=Porphyrobacter sp. YT40 TaxID=2547601 RepID=UPI0011449120|nr:hypothetical protein [Porphyrobacter sp. YT40]QDH34281.1 hypothetical protein E2E27_08085 [Porphyrobacter sp. YT40]
MRGQVTTLRVTGSSTFANHVAAQATTDIANNLHLQLRHEPIGGDSEIVEAGTVKARHLTMCGGLISRRVDLIEVTA